MALLDEIHRITGQGFKSHTYREARAYEFATAAHVQVGDRGGVIDAYSGTFVEGASAQGVRYRELGDGNGDGYCDRKGMDIEHVWPKSSFVWGTPMVGDLHNFLTTFAHINSTRGDRPFCEVPGPGVYRNSAGAKCTGGVFEPPDEAKGRVARAVLYFYARYSDHDIISGRFGKFWNENLETQLRWNRTWLPDEHELAHNDRTEAFQGNRNPFIDIPSLADEIGIEALTRPESAQLPKSGRETGAATPPKRRSKSAARFLGSLRVPLSRAARRW